MTVGEKGVAWRRLRVHGTPGHGSMPFRIDNALVKAALVVQRLAEYRPAPRFHELWPARVESLNVPDDLKRALLDPDRIDATLDALPSAAAAAHLHACTHTTFSPNLIDGGVMKTNVIPDSITLDVDVRTLPGEGTDEVTAHLRAALGELADHVEVEIILDDPASISRTGTPLWDSLQQAVAVPFPGATLAPAVQRRLHRRPGLPRARGDLLRRRAVQPDRRLGRVRPAVPRPRRARRRRVARADRRAVAACRHRPDDLMT